MNIILLNGVYTTDGKLDLQADILADVQDDLTAVVSHMFIFRKTTV